MQSWIGFEINPNTSFVHFLLASALAYLGHLEEAKAATQTGLALDPALTMRRLRLGALRNHPIYLAQRERILVGIQMGWGVRGLKLERVQFYFCFGSINGRVVRQTRGTRYSSPLPPWESLPRDGDDVPHQLVQSQRSVGFFDCLDPVSANPRPDDTTTADQRLNFASTRLPTSAPSCPPAIRCFL